MSVFTKLVTIGVLALTLSGCQREEAPSSPAESQLADSQQTTVNPETEPVADSSAKLNTLFAEFFEEGLEFSPILATSIGRNEFNDQLPNVFAQEYRDRQREYNQAYLDRIRLIDRDSLSAEDRISYDIFVYDREQFIESQKYPSYLLPLSQFFSIANFIASLGSGSSMQPFNTVEDYDNWVSRANDYVVVSDQMITNMRDGMALGVVQPRVIMERTLPQLSAHVVDNPEESIFFTPITNMPEEFSDEDRERLTEAYRVLVTEQLAPAYARLHDFVRDEYIPNTRETLGTTDLPDGVAWYDYLLANQTTTDMTAEEIHEFGLAEVARIRAEMEQVARQVEFEGSLAEFFAELKANDRFYYETEEELIGAYVEIQGRINESLPALFDVFPKADYEVRPVEAFQAASSAGAYYQAPSPDGSRPGIFYINTYNLRAQPKYGVETLSLHEAAPGHHFQVSIQQEIENMPMFRRIGGFTAFAEGWGLYAESLGKELGLFTDPYQWFGRLSDEMLRAMRLVIDTGLHAKGWTREQSIEYMLENSDLAESDVIAEVERYIAMPGQAVTYKVGERIIRQLRSEAEQALGEAFDIREFHSLVLTGGSMPMEVLKQRVRDWVEAK